MVRSETYIDLKGQSLPLNHLDDGERKLVARLRRRYRQRPEWGDFSNYWLKAVAAFYEPRGLTRRQIVLTAPFRIAQDLDGRLAIAGGYARLPDYRDELEEIIRTRFRTRREFCQATGLSEDMLSHVLRKRKHLAIDTLAEALGHIGYTLRIAPLPKVQAG